MDNLVLTNSKNFKNINIMRAGVILYTVYNDNLFFCLSIDSNTLDFCDFGGGREPNELLINTAIRELAEETYFTFDINNTLNNFNVNDNYSIIQDNRDLTIPYSNPIYSTQNNKAQVQYNINKVLMFLPIDDMDDFTRKFNYNYNIARELIYSQYDIPNHHIQLETLGIKWVSVTEMNKLLNMGSLPNGLGTESKLWISLILSIRPCFRTLVDRLIARFDNTNKISTTDKYLESLL